MEYLVWPDGTFCEPAELEEMLLRGQSDDFEIIEVSDEEEIHDHVMKRQTQFKQIMEALLC